MSFGDVFITAAWIFLSAILIAIWVLFLLTVYRTFKECDKQRRDLKPGLTWLAIIPFFNLVWDFVIVLTLSSSLEKELKARALPHERFPARDLGLALCITLLIPMISVAIVAYFAFIAGLIIFAIYWYKVYTFLTLLKNSKTVEPGSEIETR